ncbi:MAG: DUF2914 domain-containing protein [Patescibacteria group bacterium]
MKIISIQKIRAWRLKYERYFSPLALFIGFIVDNLTLRRIDLQAENLVILSYLFIAGLSILILNFYDDKRNLKVSQPYWKSRHSWISRASDKFANFLPFVLQFAFGGLFSAFVVFYSRSASLLTSWPFLIFLAAFLIGNEFFRQRYYSRLVFQISVYFIAIFSYSVSIIPVIVKEIGTMVFIASGFVSIILIGFFIFLMRKILPVRINQSRNLIIASIGSVYVFFNILYFINVIPPIPLALKESGIYHNIRREGNDYIVQLEPAPWYRFFDDFDPVFHWRPGESVYSFSAVFAPTAIKTKIFHRWLYFNETQVKWLEQSRQGFSIIGGRDGGYRGYTVNTRIKPGKWRVDVITEEGQILGRIKFKIVEASEMPKLRREIR